MDLVTIKFHFEFYSFQVYWLTMEIIKKILTLLGQFIAIILVGLGIVLPASIPLLIVAGFFVSN